MQKIFALVYDLANLTIEQEQEGSILIGGSARYVVKVDPRQLDGAQNPRDVWHILKPYEYEAELLFLVMRWGEKYGPLALKALAAGALSEECPPPRPVLLLPNNLLVECTLNAYVERLFDWRKPEDGRNFEAIMGEQPAQFMYVMIGDQLVQYQLATRV